MADRTNDEDEVEEQAQTQSPVSQPTNYIAPWHSKSVEVTDSRLKPNLWERFSAYAAGLVDDKDGRQYRSGANVTLDDLKIKSLPPPINADGWVGVPSPDKFAPGTNVLSQKELAEEVAKGNVTPFREWIKKIDSPNEFERKMVQGTLEYDELKHRTFVVMDDGSFVSAWDLMQYVYHNPEARALYEKGGREVGRKPPWLRSPHAQEQQLTREELEGMSWAKVAEGCIWKRRPTRWLKGLDGIKDFDYAMYVHQDQAEAALGERWQGLEEEELLLDPEFHDAVRGKAPDMSAAFLIKAAREVPYPELVNRLSSHFDKLLERAAPVDAEQVRTALAPLRRNLAPAQLAGDTRLLLPDGAALRKGSVLIAATEAGGNVILYGMSPGQVREQESYVLGVAACPRLAEIIVDSFLSEQGLDPGFKFSAGVGLLPIINGYRCGNANHHPLMTFDGAPSDFDPELAMNISARSFRLPGTPIGRSVVKASPQLLTGVGEQVQFFKLASAMEAAQCAAATVPLSGLSAAAASCARRAAAEASLRHSLKDLGYPEQDLEQLSLPLELFEESTPLQVAQ